MLVEVLGLCWCSKPYRLGARISKSTLDSFWPFCVNVNSEFLKCFLINPRGNWRILPATRTFFSMGGGKEEVQQCLPVQEEAGHSWSSLRGAGLLHPGAQGQLQHPGDGGGWSILLALKLLWPTLTCRTGSQFFISSWQAEERKIWNYSFDFKLL